MDAQFLMLYGDELTSSARERWQQHREQSSVLPQLGEVFIVWLLLSIWNSPPVWRRRAIMQSFCARAMNCDWTLFLRASERANPTVCGSASWCNCCWIDASSPTVSPSLRCTHYFSRQSTNGTANRRRRTWRR